MQHTHCRLGLREGDTRLHAGEQIEPRIPFVLQVLRRIGRQRGSRVDRGPQLSEESGIGPAEFRRGNAHDSERRTIETDRGSQDVLASAVPRLPEAVLDHDDRGAFAEAIVLGREHASDERLHSEDLEEIAGHPAGLDHLATVAGEETQTVGVLTRQAGEDRVAVAKGDVHRVRERVKAVAVL